MNAYNERDLGAVDDLCVSEFEVSSPLLDGAGDFVGVHAAVSRIRPGIPSR
jgi:hypothetical protein